MANVKELWAMYSCVHKNMVSFMKTHKKSHCTNEFSAMALQSHTHTRIPVVATENNYSLRFVATLKITQNGNTSLRTSVASNIREKKSYARGWQINVCSKCALAHWFIPKPKWKEDTTADNSDFGHFVTNSMCPTKCFVDMWKQITCYDGIEISQFVANLSQRMWWRVDSFFFQKVYGRLNIASTV